MTVLSAGCFAFIATTLTFFLLHGENNSSHAQNAPGLRQRTSPMLPSGQRTLPIPAEASTLPVPNESPLFVERYAELTPEERISVQVYEQCNRSVVNIDTQTRLNHWLFGHFDDPGAGSGVVLDREGHILTNSHVISGVDNIMVTLFTGESYPVTIVGEDPITDLAVLKISAPTGDLLPAKLTDSSRLLVGQKIFAIGNPFGLERTLTSGLISSLDRTIPGRQGRARAIKGAIQIDAAINPGNSGGALLDTQGRMIGINTAIASKSGGSHGVGFAIPTNTISRIVPQLIKSGKVIRGDIGIAQTKDHERDGTKGVLVAVVTPKGAAEKAGLRGPRVVRERSLIRGAVVIQQPKVDLEAADLIVAANGVETKKTVDFTAIIDDHKPGDRVVLDVIRGGNRVQLPVVLE